MSEEDQQRWNSLSNNRADLSDDRASLADEHARVAREKTAALDVRLTAEEQRNTLIEKEAAAHIESTEAEKQKVIELATELAEKQTKAFAEAYKKLLIKVAVAMTIVSLGCFGGLYFFQHEAQHRSDVNSCAINTFVEKSKNRTAKLNLPGAQEQVRELQKVQDKLLPKIADCSNLLK